MYQVTVSRGVSRQPCWLRWLPACAGWLAGWLDWLPSSCCGAAAQFHCIWRVIVTRDSCFDPFTAAACTGKLALCPALAKASVLVPALPTV